MEAPANREVVFIHGAGGGRWEWNVWRRVFDAAGWRTHVPELCATDRGLASTRLIDYAQQISDIAASLGGPLLVGASLGGLIAAMIAHDVAAGALVLVNPVSPDAREDGARARHADGFVPWGRRRSIDGTRRAMPDADDAACLYAMRRWRDESQAVLDDAHAGVAVARPTCPTLFVIGGRDDDVSPEHGRALAHRWNADVSFRADASHVGPLLGRDAATIALDALTWVGRRWPRPAAVPVRRM